MSEFTPGPAPIPETGYRVLARKYRPTTFADLIGQEAMVRTLSNAFAADRLAQAWMLTGVRGVGKTTTARLIARAVNYAVNGEGRPTTDMPTLGDHCEAILESRHPDVIEMDAASRTGVDDVREIIEAVRYRPITARYKVYIIDEVHMLSKQAFNALLKTLEEPPPHVKFVFATTEIRKVPVTVLSRCQRFDLRRLESGALMEHYAKIAQAEGVEAEAEALRMIARAAEGSVRDGLSLLDQAIVHGGGTVTAGSVSAMLGLADRAQVIDLFDAVMRGDMATALSLFETLYSCGAEPAMILHDLADLTHYVTKLKIAPAQPRDPARTEAEDTRGRQFAQGLTMAALSRVWQMLLKGLAETQAAEDTLAAAEMVLLRLAYAAGLASTLDLAELAGEPVQRSAPSSATPAAAPAAPVPPASPPVAAPPVTAAPASVAQAAPKPDAPKLKTFRDLADEAGRRRDLKLKGDLERYARPVRVDEATGTVEFALVEGGPRTLITDLSKRLEEWTGRRWMVMLSTQAGDRPLAEAARDRRDGLLREAREHPAVRDVLARFPGAEIVDVKDAGAEPAPNESAPGDEIQQMYE
ncbi:MAG: DNA polymerase III subunit gamma/tau [Hyphomicrobiales bacterium]